MISSIHSLRSKIVVYLQDLVQRHSQEQHARSSPRMAWSASHQSSECSQTNSLSEHDLEEHSSSTFNTFLSIFTSSPEWHCCSMFPATSAATISGAASKIDCQIKDGLGPLLFVFDKAIFQHKIRNFGLFQAKTGDYGL